MFDINYVVHKKLKEIVFVTFLGISVTFSVPWVSCNQYTGTVYFVEHTVLIINTCCVPSVAKVLLPLILLNPHNLGSARDTTNKHIIKSIDICSIHQPNRVLFLSHFFPFFSWRDLMCMRGNNIFATDGTIIDRKNVPPPQPPRHRCVAVAFLISASANHMFDSEIR